MSKSISERINVDGRGCEWTNRHEWKDADNSCPASGKPATALMKDSVQTALSDHACLRDAVLEGKMKVLVAQSCPTLWNFPSKNSSILAKRIPWTEEPGRLQSMGSQRVRHDWATNTFTFKQEYWNGLPFPSPGDLPDPEIEPGPPAL